MLKKKKKIELLLLINIFGNWPKKKKKNDIEFVETFWG